MNGDGDSDPARRYRDRLRAEAARFEDIILKESRRPPGAQRRHIVDGLKVTVQVLKRLAADLAKEAQQDELMAIANDTADEGSPNAD